MLMTNSREWRVSLKVHSASTDAPELEEPWHLNLVGDHGDITRDRKGEGVLFSVYSAGSWR